MIACVVVSYNSIAGSEKADDNQTVLAAVRETQLTGTPLGKQLAESSQIILDCSTVDGVCARQRQEQLAGAVKSVVTGVSDALSPTIIAASTCASRLPDGLTEGESQLRIQSCVIRRLAAQSSKRPAP